MKRGAFFVAAALFVTACAPLRLGSVWKDDGYREGPMRRIAVLVVEQDEAVRRYAEDEAVKSLPPAAAAVPGYRLFERPERDIEKVEARLSAEGFDGALLARVVARERRKTRMPPQVHVVPGPFIGPPYYRSFYRYYPWAWEAVYTSPGYTVETTHTTAEVLVYALPGGRLVWSGILEADDGESNAALLARVVRAVREPLARDGVLPP